MTIVFGRPCLSIIIKEADPNCGTYLQFPGICVRQKRITQVGKADISVDLARIFAIHVCDLIASRLAFAICKVGTLSTVQ